MHYEAVDLWIFCVIVFQDAALRITRNKMKIQKTNTLRILALVIAAGFAVITLPAVTLVTYDFEDTGNLLSPSSGISEGLATGSLILNNVSSSGSRSYGTNRAFYITPNAAITDNYSVSSTLTNGTYISLQLTVAEGYVLSLDSLGLQAASGSATGTHRAFYVFSDLTGFSTGESTYSHVLLYDRRNVTGFSGALPVYPALGDYSANLNGISAFQSIVGAAGGTKVEFRIYIQSDGTGRSVDFGSISLNGTLTPIPEPASNALLIALGVLAICLWVRRRHS